MIKVMNLEDKLALMLFMHFGPKIHIKRLKCCNCEDYKSKVCKGKGFTFKGVLNCMAEHADSAEFFTSEDICIEN